MTEGQSNFFSDSANTEDEKAVPGQGAVDSRVPDLLSSCSQWGMNKANESCD